ncbi:PucR family transcriptional regulator [Streptomyces acidiscabies]|uniref:PucR family transcriptional regulator n=1 Tax=Streptomyces acidiscabies TaxID=42234 RepID=UPI00067C5665|nr:helix-turn-helix domain-containing protein [Streptomyces acidiscabies]
MNGPTGAGHRVQAPPHPRGIRHGLRRPATGPVRAPLDPGNSWILQLRPHTPGALLAAAGDEALVREARLLVGDGATGWAVEVAARMASAGSAGRQPAGPAAAVPSRALDELGVRGAEALALHVLISLAGYGGEGIPEIIGASVRESIRRGLPVGGTFDVLKNQLDCFVQELFHACVDLLDPAEAAEVTRTLSGALVAEVQHVLLTLAEQAEQERRGWSGSAAAHHQELVLDILDGADVDAPQAFLRLGYDLSRTHLALVVWRDDWDAHGTADLASAATALLHGAGCSSLLTVPVGVSSLWAWGARTRGNPLSPGRLRDAGGPHRQPPGVHVAAGLPGEGIEGFRTSHRQARETAELIRAAGPGAGGRRPPYDYADLELAVLLRSRPDLSAGFVRRELGPLAGDGMAELRATVKCYLDLERSMSAAAERLHIAKSSVAYRIRKAERLLGRPVQEDRLRLHSALLLFDVLGEAALDT